MSEELIQPELHEHLCEAMAVAAAAPPEAAGSRLWGFFKRIAGGAGTVIQEGVADAVAAGANNPQAVLTYLKAMPSLGALPPGLWTLLQTLLPLILPFLMSLLTPKPAPTPAPAA